jgi:hypothetical protein
VQYLSRPFVVGDKIDVMTSSGGKVVSGFVEEVSPMRTHLRTDHWMSIMVPNKVREDFCLHHPSASSSHSAKPKQLPSWISGSCQCQGQLFRYLLTHLIHRSSCGKDNCQEWFLLRRCCLSSSYPTSPGSKSPRTCATTTRCACSTSQPASAMR